jgi:hypothetical protein
MNLTVGWQRKVGQPNFGSLSASCSVTVELNGTMVFDDLEAFHRHVRQAYVACQQAVNDQLAREQESTRAATPERNAQSASPAENAAAHNDNGSGGNGNRASNGHQASEKQMTYIQQLARQIRGLGVRQLEALASRMFGKPMVSLTSLDASSLIDTLKAIKAGEIDLETTLNGAEK